MPFDNVPDIQRHHGLGLMRLSPDFMVEAVNPAGGAILGYAPSALTGCALSTLLVPGTVDEACLQRQKQLSRGEIEHDHQELQFVHQVGQTVSVLWDAALIRDGAGQPAGCIACLVDMTNWRQAEQLLQAERDLGLALSRSVTLAEALDLCLDKAIRVSEMDSGGIYVVNPEDNSLTLSVHKGLQPAFIKKVSRYDAASFQARLIMEGKPVYWNASQPHFLSGLGFQEEGLKSLAIIPVWRGGRIIAALNVASHVREHIPETWRLLLESIQSHIGVFIEQASQQAALRESEKKYRTLIETTAEGYCQIDLAFTVVDVNQAFGRMLGYDKAAVRGQKLSAFLTEDSRRVFFFQTLQLRAMPQRSYELSFQARTGGTVQALVNATAIRDEKGRMTGAFALLTDITAQKQIEAQLKQAQRMEALGTLAGGIAHNFNNILMGISGNIDLMILDKAPGDPDLRTLKEVAEYVRGAAEMTKDLLGFARGGQYEVAPTNLNELIKNENRIFGRTRKEITVKGHYEKNLWPAAVDQQQMQQVLMNIYVNAAQAMPGGGNLTVTTANVRVDETYISQMPFQIEPGRYVKITVSDTGMGMDEVVKDKVFEPFFTTKGIGQGTGLGMSSVYGIVKNHNGFINVYSEIGQGTTFSIYLPATLADTAPEASNVRPVPAPARSETILLADDEALILDVGQRMLARQGYEVLTADNGQDAYEIYAREKDRVDLVVLDMIMPGLSGQETFTKIKAINPEVKVLLSSGYSFNEQARAILDQGCRGFIQKPFSLSEMSEKIRSILDDPPVTKTTSAQ